MGAVGTRQSRRTVHVDGLHACLLRATEGSLRNDCSRLGFRDPTSSDLRRLPRRTPTQRRGRRALVNSLIERVKSAMVGLGTGWILMLMLMLSIISLAIMLERAWFYWSLRDDIEALMRDLGRFLRGGDLEGARRRLEESRSAEAAVDVAGLVEADRGFGAAEEAMMGAS